MIPFSSGEKILGGGRWLHRCQPWILLFHTQCDDANPRGSQKQAKLSAYLGEGTSRIADLKMTYLDSANLNGAVSLESDDEWEALKERSF